jgi:FkbM family methyltransferase
LLSQMYKRILRIRNSGKQRVRQFRRLMRRELLRRFRRRTRGIRRVVDLVRLLGFAQEIRLIALRLRGAQIIALRIPGVRTPLLCRTIGSDRRVLWQIFCKRHLDIDLQDSPRLIIDGGAYVGYSSIYFANKYPDAQIIAVEPDPENCALFRKNCAAYPNVELVQGALWSSNTDLMIENPDVKSWAFRVVEAPTPTNRSFRGFTVADILARSGEEHIDLLKLDIEGSEERLFSSNYCDWLPHVKNMMIEVHGERRHDIVFAATKAFSFSVSRSREYTIFQKET